MNKLFLSAVSVIAIAGVAGAADSTQFGVLRVPSSLKKTIVSVPWLESGTGTQNVTISNLVLTADLEVGDLLKYYNGSSYECWRLAEGAGNVKYWQSVVMDNGNGDYVPTGNPAETTIARGKAIILDRCGKPAEGTRDLSKGFCIMGKPADGSVVTTLLASSSSASAYSLIAPPNVNGATDVNTGMTWTNIEVGDLLALNTANGVKYYGYAKTSRAENIYKWVDAQTGSQQNITIPCGQGAWFISKATAVTNKKASWGAAN